MPAARTRRPPGASRTSRRRRRLGQHFLADPGVVERLLQSLEPLEESAILEIGPGQGVLTCPLAGAAAALLAVELDPSLAEGLQVLARPGKVRILQSDALERPAAEFLVQPPLDGHATVRLVGNLPYSAATPIIRRFMACHGRLTDLTVMIQTEVAQRLLAGPGEPEYGALSVERTLTAAGEALFDVRPGSFRPPPAVESRVIRLRPLAPLPGREGALRLARDGFSQRRKTFLNACAGAGRPLEPLRAAMETLGIPETSRAQELPAEVLLRLATLTAAP